MNAGIIADMALARIVADPELQARADPSEEVAEEFADQLTDGVDLWGPRGDAFPVVYYDGATYWLADGFTRFRAHELAARKVMRVRISQGTRRDALLYAVSANIQHGQRATLEDKRHAARMLLGLPSLPGQESMSDREIGRRCGLDHKTVGVLRVRGEIPQSDSKNRQVTFDPWRKAESWLRSGVKRLASLAEEHTEVAVWLQQGETILKRLAPAGV